MTESAARRLRWRLQRMRHSLDEALADMNEPDEPEKSVSDDLREVRARVDALESRVSAIEERWQSRE